MELHHYIVAEKTKLKTEVTSLYLLPFPTNIMMFAPALEENRTQVLVIYRVKEFDTYIDAQRAR